MASRLGIIDLGTNTFHLLIVEKSGDGATPLYQTSRPARIGKGGINQRVITAEAIQRALGVLRSFREKLDEYQVPLDHTFAFGTSAIRNADNCAEFCAIILRETGIKITVINGDEEARYIYHGVRSALDLGSRTSLIIDIGGGSVEFIICNKQQIFWKRSFEIGGQRLMERFMRTDPLAESDRKRLYNYFDEQLIPLANAVHQYAPTVLVGSSGSFDTLVDMDYHHRTGQWPPRHKKSYELPREEFYRSYELLVTRSHPERMALPGMIELRVDMIVVAVCLIDYLLRTYGIHDIRVSTYSLKEGVLATMSEE
ncbi:phosphatase [Telluribacter sp.]|jgi:exopolyphosphatase/guanosine-5'-triphosphate,3'-diphosphate pyrophosphatase|uniref:Ppx/GppA phosphatase family protein n=1 Tax=Telluribacter sp. TaxID=1978767 RepID=UPI002E0DA76D|nr:phosphatase [Telluribacter sp.]